MFDSNNGVYVAKDECGVWYEYYERPRRCKKVWLPTGEGLKVKKIAGQDMPKVPWKDSLYLLLNNRLQEVSINKTVK